MKVAFQGVLGAYSHQAAQNIYPDAEYIGCETFAKVLELTAAGVVDRAVVPIENSKAGRVADIHFLLPGTGLFVIGEYYLRVRHQLWGLPGAKLEKVSEAYSHPQALAQCAGFLNKHDIKPFSTQDTALSCKQIAEMKDLTAAAIASEAAGKLYGLEKLAADIEDSEHNTTRFLVMSREALKESPQEGKKYKTAMVFRVKNIPSALFWALGCFARERLNLTKLESYLVDGGFVAAQFYAEVEAHQEQDEFKQALTSLKGVCDTIHVLGSYPTGVAAV